MQLAVMILNQEELLDVLLEGFLEIGISGATIIDSMGMGHILSTEVPIFAGLKFMFTGSRPYNKTIISAINEDKMAPMKTIVEKILGPLQDSGNGLLFFLPISDILGLKAEI